VYNTALSLVQDPATAEDICQEVFVTIFQSVGSFSGKSSVSTWVYRITVNKCLDHLRWAKRKKRNADILPIPGADTGFQGPHSFDHPGIRTEQRENARYLFAAIDRLPENQKTAFVLAFVEELPQADVAAVMRISVKAVESLLQRGKANLRKMLSQIYPKEK